MSNGIMNTLIGNVKVNEMLDIELEGWSDAIVENYDGKNSDLEFKDMTLNEVMMTLIEMVSQEKSAIDYRDEIISDLHTIDVPIIKNVDDEVKFEQLVKDMNLPTATAYYSDYNTIDPFNQI